jgi:hypothetical protein
MVETTVFATKCLSRNRQGVNPIDLQDSPIDLQTAWRSIIDLQAGLSGNYRRFLEINYSVLEINYSVLEINLECLRDLLSIHEGLYKSFSKISVQFIKFFFIHL